MKLKTWRRTFAPPFPCAMENFWEIAASCRKKKERVRSGFVRRVEGCPIGSPHPLFHRSCSEFLLFRVVNWDDRLHRLGRPFFLSRKGAGASSTLSALLAPLPCQRGVNTPLTSSLASSILIFLVRGPPSLLVCWSYRS